MKPFTEEFEKLIGNIKFIYEKHGQELKRITSNIYHKDFEVIIVAKMKNNFEEVAKDLEADMMKLLEDFPE